jgi:opacity protein-like surface antigen
MYAPFFSRRVQRLILRLALICSALCGASAAAAQGLSAELYGGVTPERSEHYDGTSLDLNSGTALGFGVYTDRFLGRTELGFDVMHSDAGYSGLTSGVESLSVMAVARVGFTLGSTIDGYFGAGLGAINVKYDDGNTPALTGDETVPGGQVTLGVRYDVTPRAGVFAELKYQRAFDDANAAGFTQSYGSTSAIVGLRLGF